MLQIQLGRSIAKAAAATRVLAVWKITVSKLLSSEKYRRMGMSRALMRQMEKGAKVADKRLGCESLSIALTTLHTTPDLG